MCASVRPSTSDNAGAHLFICAHLAWPGVGLNQRPDHRVLNENATNEFKTVLQLSFCSSNARKCLLLNITLTGLEIGLEDEAQIGKQSEKVRKNKGRKTADKLGRIREKRVC